LNVGEKKGELLMGQSYEALLSKALQSGDQEKIKAVFGEIYGAYAKLVFFSLSRYLKDEEDMKDVTNDAFLAFFSHAEEVRGSVKYYLVSTAKNLALNRLKKDKKANFTDSIEEYGDASPQDGSLIYHEFVNDLRAVLSEEATRIVLLRAVDGLAFAEIGKKLSITEDAARMAYQRAKRKFRQSKRGKRYGK
jgi:RNA polymerase sigma factor (sigma-70 family)